MVGKCSVCGIGKAVWLDREVGVKLCEHCYGRGVREAAREAGVVLTVPRALPQIKGVRKGLKGPLRNRPKETFIFPKREAP